MFDLMTPCITINRLEFAATRAVRRGDEESALECFKQIKDVVVQVLINYEKMPCESSESSES